MGEKNMVCNELAGWVTRGLPSRASPPTSVDVSCPEQMQVSKKHMYFCPMCPSEDILFPKFWIHMQAAGRSQHS